MSDCGVISCGKKSSYSSQKQHQKIIINDGGFIISVMDVPMQKTEAEEENGITDKNIDLQRPSNSRTIVNSLETVHSDPEALEAQ